ncbi:MAG: helix-turn-helix transcriptional regulator [Planctomycetaceae bacterium]
MAQLDTIRPEPLTRDDTPRFLDYEEVGRMIRASKRTVQRMVARGDFVEPIYLSERTVVFAEHEVRDWMWDQIETRGHG